MRRAAPFQYAHQRRSAAPFLYRHRSKTKTAIRTQPSTPRISTSWSETPRATSRYSGFDRLYKFFESDDHIRLEKKFRYQISIDISKCFDSIYTHSIAWATKSKDEAKENISALTFGNHFDKVMQRLNHNETSGICIGPKLVASLQKSYYRK